MIQWRCTDPFVNNLIVFNWYDLSIYQNLYTSIRYLTFMKQIIIIINSCSNKHG